MSNISSIGQPVQLSNSAGSKPGESMSSTGTIPAQSDSSSATAIANENAELTVHEVDQTVETLNQAMTLLQRGISFEIDRNMERTIIKVVDKETDELIKQIPSEDLLKIIEHMQEMQHLLFDGEA